MQIRSSPEDSSSQPLFSIVMVTFARDHLVPETIAQAAKVAADRLHEVEFVLVDNNADEVDRSAFLAPFTHWQYVKLGFNKGVTVTAGLKTVFTTPAHGTAYDIVGQNKADPGAMEHALRIAATMAAARAPAVKQ